MDPLREDALVGMEVDVELEPDEVICKQAFGPADAVGPGRDRALASTRRGHRLRPSISPVKPSAA